MTDEKKKASVVKRFFRMIFIIGGLIFFLLCTGVILGGRQAKKQREASNKQGSTLLSQAKAARDRGELEKAYNLACEAESSLSWGNPQHDTAMRLSDQISQAIGEQAEPELKVIIGNARKLRDSGDVESAKTEYRKALTERFTKAPSRQQAENEYGALLEREVQVQLTKATTCEKTGDHVGAIAALRLASDYKYVHAPSHTTAIMRLEKLKTASVPDAIPTDIEGSPANITGIPCVTLSDYKRSDPLLAKINPTVKTDADGSNLYIWKLGGHWLGLSGNPENITSLAVYLSFPLDDQKALKSGDLISAIMVNAATGWSRKGVHDWIAENFATGAERKVNGKTVRFKTTGNADGVSILLIVK